MKKVIALLFAVVVLTGCNQVSSPIGAAIISAKGPVTATANGNAARTGESTCTGILLFAFGDCSIDAAKRNGNINTVSSVDSDTFSVLGIYSTYTTRVRGN